MSNVPAPEPGTSDDPRSADSVMDPPKTIGGILKHLGPGLIIAASIVGSGELIATTAVGAEAGFTLMWLIIIGCLIKVFVQVEFGKYTIINGRTTLDGMNEVPGPRFGGPRHRRVNWVCWFWLVFILVALVQIGGIIGGVGQAVSIPVPLTERGKVVDEYHALAIRAQVLNGIIERFDEEQEGAERVNDLQAELGDVETRLSVIEGSDIDTVRRQVLIRLATIDELLAYYKTKPSSDSYVLKLTTEKAALDAILDERFSESPALTERQQSYVSSEALSQVRTIAGNEKWDKESLARVDQYFGQANAWKQSDDPLIWAALITAVSMVVLVVGRYRLIQNVSTALVAMFTMVTIGNLIYLQLQPDWRVNWSDLLHGMSFQIPPGAGMATALAAFGIIGVGATELIQYPYWCLEKGYAKWAGPRDSSEAWAKRAEGWVRVLKWDAWCSMVVYTFATIAFYLLGAAILGRTGLNPSGDQMVRTLAEMYVPVFGDAAELIFLFGAFAVLYSTFFVATASHARTLSDALRVFGVSAGGDKAYVFWTRVFCGTLPLLFLASFAYFKAPKQLVLAGGFMGALMLPILGISALYFRYQRCDERLQPRLIWDLMLWISVLGLFIAGGWALYDKVFSG